MARILLIDSDDYMAGILKASLVSEGYRVDLARTGGEALRQMESLEYDVALVERQLPDLDGIEICRSISASKPYVPVVMVSFRCALEDRVAALDAGAQDFIARPFQMAELTARLRSLLRRYVRQSFAPEAVEPAVPVLPVPAAVAPVVY